MPKTEVCVTVIGEQSTGKSSLVAQMTNGTFDENCMPTIGFNMHKKEVTKTTLVLWKRTDTLKLWDMGGDQRFHSMYERYSRGSVVILVVDLTNPNGLAAIEKFHNTKYINEASLSSTIVVATKADLPFAISASEFKKLCEAKNLPYFFTSAKLNYGVIEVSQHAFQMGAKRAPIFQQEQYFGDYPAWYKTQLLTNHIERAEVVKVAIERTDLTPQQKLAIADNQVAVFDKSKEIKAIPESLLAARWTDRAKLKNPPKDEAKSESGFFKEINKVRARLSAPVTIAEVNPAIFEEKSSSHLIPSFSISADSKK